MRPPSSISTIEMDRSLADTQSLPDYRQLPIDRVGVKNLRFPTSVQDRSGNSQPTVATVALTVDLPQHYKGTHMSRFVEILHEHGATLHAGGIKNILSELQERLDAQQAHIEFDFPFFVEKRAPVTEARGLMDYGVRVFATLVGQKFEIQTTVLVPVSTVCPCSKAISQFGAHNQRSLVTFTVRSSASLYWEDLIGMVEDAASCELFSVLKRPDEKEVTERAYEHPVFVEDLVRNVAVRANLEQAFHWYRVEAENYESIHNHNAYAMIEKG